MQDDFLATAAMEGRTFEATRERIVIMEPGLVQAGVAPAGWVRFCCRRSAPTARLMCISAASPWCSERSRADEFRTLQIPRRPEWDASTTPAELDERERKSFLEWRRGIARCGLQSAQHSADARLTGVCAHGGCAHGGCAHGGCAGWRRGRAQCRRPRLRRT